MASGGAAGATSLAFVYSLDYARTRLANDNKSAKKGGTREFNGLVDVYRKTIASDGIAGLYRGFVISCVGIVVYRGLYFGMYDSIKPVLLVGDLAVSGGWTRRAGGPGLQAADRVRRSAAPCLAGWCRQATAPGNPAGQPRQATLRPPPSMQMWSHAPLLSSAPTTFYDPHHPQDNFLASFLLGWGITIGAGLASYPIDTVRRRMMMTSGQAVKYKSSIDCFNQVLKNEGAKSLFKGAGANILRAVAGAGVLSGYDQLQLIMFGKKFGDGSG